MGMTFKHLLAAAAASCGLSAIAAPGAYSTWFDNAVPSYGTQNSGWTTSEAATLADDVLTLEDCTDGVCYTPTTEAAKDYQKQTITISSEAVDWRELPEGDSETMQSAKFAVCLAYPTNGGDPVFAAYTATGWVEVSGLVPAEGTDHTLVIEYCKTDNTFTITEGTAKSAPLNAVATETPAAALSSTTIVGTGAVTSLTGEEADYYAACIGDKNYTSLEAAIAAGTDTSETPIVLLEDATLPAVDTVDTEVTYFINANGHVLSAPDGCYMVVDGTTVTEGKKAAQGDQLVETDLDKTFTAIDGASGMTVSTLTIPASEKLPLGSKVTIQSIGFAYRNSCSDQLGLCSAFDEAKMSTAKETSTKEILGASRKWVTYTFNNLEVTVGEPTPCYQYTTAGVRATSDLALAQPAGYNALKQDNFTTRSMMYEIAYTVTSIGTVDSADHVITDGVWDSEPAANAILTGSLTVTGSGEGVLSNTITGNVIIENGATLVVTCSGLKQTKTTNNGTIKVRGGTAVDPIVIYEDGAVNSSIGTVVIEENSVLRSYAVGAGNRSYAVTGASQTTSRLILDADHGWGMPDTARIRNCTLEVAREFWLEGNQTVDKTVDVILNGVTHLGRNSENAAFEIGTLSGTANIAPTGSPTLTVNMDTDDTSYAGTLGGVAMTVTGAHALTLTSTFASAVKGDGRIRYTGGFGTLSDATKTSLQAVDWTGTLVIDGQSNLDSINNGSVGNSASGYRTLLNYYGNEGSKIELLNCTYEGDGNGNNYFGLTLDSDLEATVVKPEIIITGDLKLRNGFSQASNSKTYRTEFRKLSGTGTILATRGNVAPLIYVYDASEFTGAINSAGYKFVFGERGAEAESVVDAGSITIKDGNTLACSGSVSKVILQNGAIVAPAATPLTTATLADCAATDAITVQNATAGMTVLTVTGTKPTVLPHLKNDPQHLLAFDGTALKVQDAVASYAGVAYPTVQAAIDAATDENIGSVIVYGSPALPAGYAIVTTEGVQTLRKAGEIYFVSGNLFNEEATFQTVDGGSTAYLTGDTIVIDATTDDTEIYLKSASAYKKFRIAKDFAIHAGEDNKSLLDEMVITVDAGVTLTISEAWSHAFTLGSVTFKGAGTVDVGNKVPTNTTTTDSLQDGENWTGTLWIKNVKASNWSDSNRNTALVDAGVLAKLGNANSTVAMTECDGYIPDGDNNVNYPWALKVINGSSDPTYGWENQSGWSARAHKFGGLIGDGELRFTSMGGSSCNEREIFGTAEDFRGTINVGHDWDGTYTRPGKRVVIGDDSDAENIQGLIHVSVGQSVTIAVGKTWYANHVCVKGTMTIEDGGTLTCNELKLGAVEAKIISAQPITDIISGVEGRAVTASVIDGMNVYVLSLAESEITPSVDGLVINVADVTITRGDETVTGTTIPPVTGVYTVKKGEVVVAEVAVVAQAPAEKTTLVAVPFEGLDGAAVTAASLLNTKLLAEGDQLKVYDGANYRFWTLDADKAWVARSTISADGAVAAGEASAMTLTCGTAVWVTTAKTIMTYGRKNADGVKPVVTSGVNLLGNTKMVATDLADIAETGDEVEIPGDTSGVRTFTKTASGWSGVKTVVEKVPGLPVPEVNRTVETTEAPSVPAGRGYFLRRQ